MKYFSMFSGIGGFELGIEKAYESNFKRKHSGKKPKKKKRSQGGVGSADKHNEVLCDPDRTAPLCVGYSEIDKYAIQIYEKHFPFKECKWCKENRESLQGAEWGGVRPIGNKPNTPSGDNEQSETRRDRKLEQPENNCQCEHKPYGDATKINATTLPDFDLLVGGFPCQAFSIAGKRGGFDDTRGTLFFDIARILKEKRPRNFVLENVKGLLSHDGGRTFKTIITTLVELGYCVEWQVLNAKNFGVPQNRERVFIVGHFGGIPERKVFPIGEDDGILDSTDGTDRTRTQAKYSTTIRGGNIKADNTFVSVIRATEYKHGDNQTTIAEANMKIRRLTPLECERLMGYPDGWTEGLSDTQRYKTLGNGIVSNVVEEVVKKLF